MGALPIPEDLIVFLFFAFFVLVQILRARRRRKARRADAPPAAPVEADTDTVDTSPVPAPWTPELVEGPRPKPVPQARPAAATGPSAGGRHPRLRLLGDRRSLQDAIVAATVLGPCLAQRPRDRP